MRHQGWDETPACPGLTLHFLWDQDWLSHSGKLSKGMQAPASCQGSRADAERKHFNVTGDSHVSSSSQGRARARGAGSVNQFPGHRPCPAVRTLRWPGLLGHREERGTDATSRALDFFTAALSIFFEGPELLPSSGPRSPLFLLSCKTNKIRPGTAEAAARQAAGSSRGGDGGGGRCSTHGEMPGSSAQGRERSLAPHSQRRQTPGLGSKAGAHAAP